MGRDRDTFASFDPADVATQIVFQFADARRRHGADYSHMWPHLQALCWGREGRAPGVACPIFRKPAPIFPIVFNSVTHKSAKSLMRMLGPKGNPQARHLLDVIVQLQRAERLDLRVLLKSAQRGSPGYPAQPATRPIRDRRRVWVSDSTALKSRDHVPRRQLPLRPETPDREDASHDDDDPPIRIDRRSSGRRQRSPGFEHRHGQEGCQDCDDRARQKGDPGRTGVGVLRRLQ